MFTVAGMSRSGVAVLMTMRSTSPASRLAAASARVAASAPRSVRQWRTSPVLRSTARWRLLMATKASIHCSQVGLTPKRRASVALSIGGPGRAVPADKIEISACPPGVFSNAGSLETGWRAAQVQLQRDRALSAVQDLHVAFAEHALVLAADAGDLEVLPVPLAHAGEIHDGGVVERSAAQVDLLAVVGDQVIIGLAGCHDPRGADRGADLLPGLVPDDVVV